MKRWLCVLLALALCLSAAGCVQPPVEGPAPAKEPARPAPEKTDDPLLLAMEAELTGARPGDVRVDPPGEYQRVRMSRALVEGIANLLTVSPFERVEMRSIEGEGDLGYQQVSVLGGGKVCSLELFLCGESHALYPGKTVLWLQVGEETGQYLFDGAVYDDIARLVGKNTVPDVVSLEGEFLPLDSQNSASQDAYPRELLQLGGILLVRCEDADGKALFEAFDTSSGEALYDFASETGIDRMEKTSYNGWDYRIVQENGVVSYRSASDPEKSEEVNLPLALWRRLEQPWTGSYDLDPAAGLAVCADEEGVWLSGPGDTVRRALSSDGLPGVLGDRYPADLPGDFPKPRYTEPRLHGGGRILTAVVTIPGSQSDYAALAVCDLAAGTTGYYRNFGAMRSGTAYPGDLTVVMRSDTVDTVLDLSTGETRESPVMIDRGVRELYTADYENYLSARSSRADDGQSLVELAAYGEDKPLFTAAGGQFHVAGVTPDYAICRYRDGQQAGTLLLRWNRAGALTLHSLLAGETERAGASPIDAYGTGDAVAILARAADGSWFVESFDAKTGRSFGDGVRLGRETRPVALAPAYDRAGYDYRLLTAESVLYGKFGQQLPEEEYTLPDRIATALLPDDGSFDLSGETIAYAAEDGVWTARADGTGEQLRLPNREIGQRTDNIPARYAFPRLMGGGRFLVGMQAILGGETIYCGFTVLDLATGEKTEVFDPDGNYPGGVLYPNDYTVGLRQGETVDYYSLPDLRRAAGPNEPYPSEAYRFA
ncbi:hypothetical protein [uncultured Anaerotruncus sp.]|uniref:hypothetical protein n=1 Tax=uncultured Anaerotruncus sp. TaxID=905011 RepID=UPI00280ACDED|nr:hypothetical protein [uncultured Anaerotruncus sp.]